MIEEQEQYLIPPEMTWFESLQWFYNAPGHQINVIIITAVLTILIIRHIKKHHD